MTLMTATDCQVDQAMYDLGKWQKLPSSSVPSQTTRISRDQALDTDSEDDIPFPETDFTMGRTPSGQTTPSEAITPPNGIEGVVNIARSDRSRSVMGTESPRFLSNVEPPFKPLIKPLEELVDVPRKPLKDAAVLQNRVHETEPPTIEVNPTTTVQIRAPLAYDASAPASTRLRHMIKNLDHILVCPGVYDGNFDSHLSFLYNAKSRKSGLSARIALSVGFEGMYMTGAGTNASVSLIAP